MTNDRIMNYMHLTGSGLIVYPPPIAQWQSQIEKKFVEPHVDARTHVSYIAKVNPNRKGYKANTNVTQLDLLSRFTSPLEKSNFPSSFTSSFRSSHEANQVKKRVAECLEGTELVGPHRDKWPHHNYFGKGGLIFQLEFSRISDARAKSECLVQSNSKHWFLTSYSPWPMKRAKLTCMYIEDDVHENLVRRKTSYTPVGACNKTIWNIASSVYEYISHQFQD